MQPRLLSLLVVTSVACGNVSNPSGDDHPDAGTTPTDGSGGGGDGGESIELAPSSLDFGQVSVALPPAPKTVTFTNRTKAATTIVAEVSGADASAFVIDHSACDKVIGPGESCDLSVSIAVSHDGAYIASLDASASTFHTSSMLAANSLHASLQLSPANDSFSDVPLASAPTRQYTLTNTGDVALPMPALTKTGTGPYTLDGTTCPTTLAPGANCTFGVKFSPTALGTQNATFTATSGTLTAKTQLSGRGISTLTVTRQGSGGGSLSINGVACATPCTVTIASTPVSLGVAASAGSGFAGWGGSAAGCGTNLTCSLGVTTATVSAVVTFNDLPTLTIDVNSLLGDVTLNNPPSSCSTTCTHDYTTATTVQLKAVFDSTACIEFAGWTGACSGTSSTTCNLTVSSNVTVGALFDVDPDCTPQ